MHGMQVKSCDFQIQLQAHFPRIQPTFRWHLPFVAVRAIQDPKKV